MQYDNQLTEVKTLLPAAKSVLIALPTGSSIDKLAAGLSLFLLLEQQGKEVFIVCEDTITVGQSHLFGIDHVQKTLPQTGGGNLTITLEDVASADGTVPSLQKLDWFAENNNLNLVFHVMPGQTFQPSKIVPHYAGSGFNLIVTIGTNSLSNLGGVYNQNPQIFSGVHILNIDNQSSNTGFGQTNVVDTSASSISEMLASIIPGLGLNLDADSASNLLAGIFEATNNLTSPNTSADTFMAVANCLRVGGKKPQPQQPGLGLDLSGLMPEQQPAPNYQPEPFVTPPVVTPSQSQQPADASQQVTTSENQPSPEERPVGEGVVSETIEPEWLTPKVFKGTSIG